MPTTAPIATPNGAGTLLFSNAGHTKGTWVKLGNVYSGRTGYLLYLEESRPPTPRVTYYADAARIVLTQAATSATTSYRYIHTDHLGTPVAVTDKDKRVVWRASYDPFGAATVSDDPDNDGQRVTLNLRFPGQYADAESGLHYNYFRTYAPATGRFLESDPIELRGGMNTFAYALGNPVSNADITGLDVTVCVYPGEPPHIGLSVNSSQTMGRRTAAENYSPGELSRLLNGGDVPSEVSPDPGNGHQKCTTIPTNSEEDRMISDYIRANQRSPGPYNLYTRSCTDFVRDGLEKLPGIDLKDETDWPQFLYDEIERDYGLQPMDKQ